MKKRKITPEILHLFVNDSRVVLSLPTIEMIIKKKSVEKIISELGKMAIWTKHNELTDDISEKERQRLYILIRSYQSDIKVLKMYL